MAEIVKDYLDKTSFIYKKYNSAIILAGGSGNRASSGATRKQNMLLCDLPVIVRTVNTFQNCAFINEIIIVARKDDIDLYTEYKTKYGWDKVFAIVSGGDTRFQSTINGFKKINDKSEFVYIHDAARCLVTEEEIAQTGHAACKKGAAVCGHFSVDSVSRYDGKTLSPLERKEVWISYTPQVFMTNLYRCAAYKALKDGFQPTDDVSIALHAGFQVEPVETSTQNIKITYPIDFAIAEAILKERNND